MPRLHASFSREMSVTSLGRDRGVKVQSCSKKPVFSLNYSLILTQSSIIFQIVGSSAIEVARFLAGGQH